MFLETELEMRKTGHNAVISPVRVEGKHIHELELALRDLLSRYFDHAGRNVNAVIAMSAVDNGASDGFTGAASAFEDVRGRGEESEPFLDYGDEDGVVDESGFVVQAEVAPELGAEDFVRGR